MPIFTKVADPDGANPDGGKWVEIGAGESFDVKARSGEGEFTSPEPEIPNRDDLIAELQAQIKDLQKDK